MTKRAPSGMEGARENRENGACTVYMIPSLFSGTWNQTKNYAVIQFFKVYFGCRGK